MARATGIALVTLAIHVRASEERSEDTAMKPAAGRPGLSATSKRLQPATVAGSVTCGGGFQLPRAGAWQVEARVDRPGVEGAGVVGV